MRSLRAACALLLLAANVNARVLVVVPLVSTDRSDDGTLRDQQALRAGVVGLLNRAGVDYDVVGSQACKTEFCRLGVETYNFGEAGAYTRSYDAVIHILNGAINAHGTGYRPDSLFSSTKMPKVPQLMFVNSYASLVSACSCSLGVSGSSAGYNVNTNYLGWTQVYREKVERRYRSGFLDGLLATSSKHGTVRMLVAGASNAGHAQTQLPTVPLPCIDCDSLLNATSDDSGCVVVETNDHWNPTACPTCSYTAKAIVICDYAHNADDEGDLGTAMMGLAALDSLTGGLVIKKPLQMAITIRGGFQRRNQAQRGGFVTADSAAIKASIDSLASLNVPFTVGVQVDSVAGYAAEKNWWARAPLAHYTPETWQDRDSSLAGLVGASIKKTYARVDSMFPGKVDRIALAPMFLWSPANLATVRADSLWYAYGKNGCRALITEPQLPADAGHFAYLPYQTTVAGFGQSVRVLATPWSPDSGSAIVEAGRSVDSYANNPLNSWCKNGESFWSGMAGFKMMGQTIAGGHLNDTGRASLSDNTNGSPGTAAFSPCSILTIHAGDLGSGTRSDAASRPTHPGWWAVKSVVNQALICNLIAGRQVVQIKYAQDVQP